MSAWNPPTGTWYAPTRRAMECLHKPYLRRKYKPVDNRLATAGFALATKTQLLSAVPKN